MRRKTLRTTPLVLALVFAASAHTLYAQTPTDEPTVPALVEQFIRDKVVPAGWDIGEQVANGFDPDIGAFVSPGYGGGGPSYGMQPVDEPRKTLQTALVDAQNAPIISRRSRSQTGEVSTQYDWGFGNKREQELKVTELSIRIELLPTKQKRWVYPGYILTGRRARLDENAVIEIVNVTGRPAVEFAQQTNDACVHAYLKRTKDEFERVAFYGVPEAIWRDVQVGRDARFKVLFHGTEQYESATGPRTILAAYFVPEPLWAALLEKHTPKPEPLPEVHCSPRVWTSVDGKHKVEGYAESASSKSVTIRKSDGKSVEVDLAKLSRDDVDWVKAYIAAKRPFELPSQKASGDGTGYELRLGE